MYKKSLFLGAVALALTVLLAFVGCSNPSSTDTAYVTQASSEYPYPADTVFINTRAALDGLLNEYSAETNQVRNIAFTGATGALDLALTNPLIIPTGKTVYLTQNHSVTTVNITVREGAKLVLVGEFDIGGAAGVGNLLVKGEVEVFRRLRVINNALDVADYTIENQVEPGRNTVIGKNVTVLPGATLYLDVTDIIPPQENLPNKFTPAQAWAAAGQGNLYIGNSIAGLVPGTPSTTAADVLTAYPYKVTELLTGVYPTATRSYTVTSGSPLLDAEELPAVIPQGAAILTRAFPETSAGNTLTVNGTLIANGTLKSITKIEVGNGGFLDLVETGEILQGLADLRLGPGARLRVISTVTSLQSLETLFLGDGSVMTVPTATGVTFKEDTPLALTLGKKVTYAVPMSPAAIVHTVISKDASLVGSTFIVYPNSTFTVDAGATFTVEAGSTFDISKQLVPAADASPAITINGTIATEGNGIITGPGRTAVLADPELLYKLITLGPGPNNGRIVLNWGGEFRFAAAAADYFVGPNPQTASYQWRATATDGGQIEINAQGLVIRDINGFDPLTATTMVNVTVAGTGAIILPTQTLTLDRGVTLALTNNLTLLGDTADNGGGAKLLGPGKVTVGTTASELVGGDYGWQAVGANRIVINGGTPGIAGLDNTSTPVAAAMTFTAKGLGATIKVPATAVLAIGAETEIALGGTYDKKGGEITLVGAGSNPGQINLAVATTSKITTANVAGATNSSGDLGAAGGPSIVNAGAITSIGITNVLGDGTQKTTATSTAVADLVGNVMPTGYLVSLVGAGTVNPITGGGANADGIISAATETNEDNT